MRIETKEIRVYTFDELSEKAQDRVLCKLGGWAVDNEWWDAVYDDAENVGVKIKSFDIGRSNEIDGYFIESAEESAHRIEAEHGPECDTYKTSMGYLKARDAVIDTWPRNEDGELEDEWSLDEKLDALDDEFRHDILEDYLVMLRKEYEYLTSRESIMETIDANGYEFTEDGNIY